VVLTRIQRFLILSLLFAGALALRVPRVTNEWPFNFFREVQLTSALAARNIWLTHLKSRLSPVEAKWLETRVGRFIEPPVLPALVAGIYAFVGEEIPWVSGIIAAIFWLAGGFFLFRIARNCLDDELGSCAALAFFYFTPFGILLSMAFQPESLLVLSFLVSVDAMVRRRLDHSWTKVIQVSLLCGFAALAKPGLSLIPVISTFLILDETTGSKQRVFLTFRRLVFILLTVLPSVLYMIWYILRTQPSGFAFDENAFLGSHFTVMYWEHLALLPTIPAYVKLVVGFGAFGFSALAVGLWANRLTRRVFVGLLLGYFANLLVFVHALGDLNAYGLLSSYYHWPLVPLTAIGVGAGVTYICRCLNWTTLPRKSVLAFGAMAAFAILNLSFPALGNLARPAVNDLTAYQLINSKIPRGETAVVLSGYLAQDVRFFSWLQTQSWPREMQFRKLISEEKYKELAFELRSTVESLRSKYLVLFIDQRFNTSVELMRQFETLPKLVNTTSLIIYDTQSWLTFPTRNQTSQLQVQSGQNGG